MDCFRNKNFILPGLLAAACWFHSEGNGMAQVVDKVKERTVEKVEEKAVEKSEEIADAVFLKLENIFRKKKKVEDEAPENKEGVPEKKDETEEPKTVKKGKPLKSS